MTARAAVGLEPLEQESAPLRRKITATLRAAIENGTLAAGTRLVEKDLCHNLNVSRTSLREALRELESDGLIGTTLRGMAVTRVTDEEADNIYRVRAALEALVAEQFATGANLAFRRAMAACVAQIETAYAEHRYHEILAHKTAFYEILCRGAGNLVVLDVLNRLNSRVTRLRSASLTDPRRGDASLREIRALANALAKRDAAKAGKAAADHVFAAARYTSQLRRAAKTADA